MAVFRIAARLTSGVFLQRSRASDRVMQFIVAVVLSCVYLYARTLGQKIIFALSLIFLLAVL